MLGAVLALTGFGVPTPGVAKDVSYVPSIGMVVNNASAPSAAPSSLLGVWTSRAGETQETFIRRLAVPMHAYTAQSGFEACGLLTQSHDGSQWRVVVTTNQSHMGCIEVGVDDPQFTITGESIHTHPSQVRLIIPNKADAALFPGRGMTPGDGRYQPDSNDFSEIDYQGGPGYVVIPGGVFSGPRLLHQNGSPASRTDLGRLPVVDQLATLPDSGTALPHLPRPQDHGHNDKPSTALASAVSVRNHP